MKIEIRKVQETVNDVPQDPKYTVYIKREYGTGDIHWSKDDWLHDFDLEDMRALAQKLSDTFLTPNTPDV